MSLNEKLNALKEEFGRTAPPEALKIIGGAIGDLLESGALDGVAREESAMPSFVLADSGGKTVSSDVLLSEGPLVVQFYRGVW